MQQGTFIVFMAGPTGLEPATSPVTGERSSQLSYGPKDVKDAFCVATFEAGKL